MLKRAVQHLKYGPDGEQHDENQYTGLIRDILEHGEEITSRNGGVKAVFGSAMHFSLEDDTIPLLTTKKVAWKTCLKELLWFMNGDTDNRKLKLQNVKIWNANASREFLDSRGLTNNAEDDLGPVYGHQWRYFNAPYTTCEDDYSGKGVDQLQYVVDQLKNPETRASRRIIMSAWNPCQLNEMALPPCHVMCQFNVIGRKLSCSLYQRSGDVGLGVPFNIASYAFLTHILAKHCDLDAHEFVYYLGNCHIYDDHYEALAEQIKQKPYPFPKVKITTKHDNINNYNLDEIIVSEYQHHAKVEMKMRA
tara:strand:- start:744 stop:1661 length:918 start_codon:yes stop_codon:yes gene_type:complete